MNKEVYLYILRTYGRNPLQGFGFVAEVVRTFVVRVYVVITMAQITASIASGNIEAAKRYAVYFLVAYVGASIIGAVGELVSVRTENEQYGRNMLAFYKKLVGKDVSFYRNNQTGYLASVYRQHLDSAIFIMRFIRGEALGTFISLTVPPIVLFFASPGVGLIAMFILLVQIVYILWSSTKVNEQRRLSHEIYRRVTGEVSDVITNIIAFKAGGVEDVARDRMAALSRQEVATFQKRRRASVQYDFPRNIMTAVGMTAAVYFIISQVSGLTSASLGLMILTVTYLFQIVRNVSSLPELVTTHDDLIAKIYPTLQYLDDANEKIHDPVEPVPLVIDKGAIEISHVSFSYPGRAGSGTIIPVFKDLTIHIRGGEQIGIVGLSGAGKSTLASLLLRFDEVDHGSIKIDGIDIRAVKQTDLRKNIAYVPQEPLLFHRTVRENIAYYNQDENDEELIRAAKAAHAHEFIEKLPEGYDTIVGERGIKLSGGQKQRIVIARAILKKAPIMIFDEATSALDSESEQIIQRALPEIIGKQTAIVVAHRLSTIAGLHRILVLHEGKIEESGTHAELLALKGRYYTLWQKQTVGFVQTA